MATVLKIAQTAAELDDVFRLRHQVYVIEDGKFGGVPLPGERIVDQYDAMPGVANIIAYEDGEAVGTLRINRDVGQGLPSEEVYDFSKIILERTRQHDGPPVLASGSMLAIREGWRRRRDVIQALLKTAIGVGNAWNTTHVVATINHETVSLYTKLGFEIVDEPLWVEHIGNHVVPLVAQFEPVYQWAFGGLLHEKLDAFWLDNFSSRFERILLSPGEQLFAQGQAGHHAYIVDNGWVTISRRDEEGKELVLATLAAGALFGEVALLDEQPRSASAQAPTYAEVIRLERKDFLEITRDDQRLLGQLLRVFAQRIRATDELAMVMAFAPQTGRVKFALNNARQAAMPDVKRPGTWVARFGPTEIAKSAGVREHEVRRILEMEKLDGRLEYGDRLIRFMN